MYYTYIYLVICLYILTLLYYILIILYIIYTYPMHIIGQYDVSVSYVKRLLQLDPVNSAGRQLANELADLIDSKDTTNTMTTVSNTATTATAAMPGTSQPTSYNTANTTSTATTINTALSQAQKYKVQARIHLSQGHITQAIDSCESGTILLLTQLLSNSDNTISSDNTSNSNNNNNTISTNNTVSSSNNNTLSSSDAELIKDELIAIYQLLITAYMSGQNYDQVINTANAILDIDGTNYRALSKKGEAYHKLVCIRML